MNKLLRLENVCGDVDEKHWEKVREDLDIWIHELDSKLEFSEAVDLAFSLVKDLPAERYLFWQIGLDGFIEIKITSDDFQKIAESRLRIEFNIED